MYKDRSIIVIEDDVDDRELLKEVFEELKMGKFTRFFDSCVAAFEYLLTSVENPFLIISDINLPALTGLDFLQKINENEQLRKRSVPFVFLSTASDKNIIAKAYKMFAQGFFVKPLTVVGLKQTIQIIVDYWSICRYPSGNDSNY